MKSNLLLIMPLLINTFEHDHILMRHIPFVNTNTRQKSPHFAEIHRQTGEFSIHFISRAQVFRTACFFPIVISLRSSFPMRSSRTAKGSSSGWPSGALSIYLRSSFPSLCKLYEYKSLRREWFFCAGFYIMLIRLCLLYYVNQRINPPSTVSTCPVTKLASSLAR